MAKYVNSWSGSNNSNLVGFGMNCAGINRALLVFIYVDTSSNVLNYCRYNGVDLTFEAKIPAAGVHYIYVYSMLNPPTGSLTLQVSISSVQDLHVHAITLEAVEQSGDPFGTVFFAEATSDSPSRVVTSTDRGVVVDCVGFLDDTITPTAGSGQTKVEDTTFGVTSRAASSWEEGASPNVTMSWSLSSSVAWLMAGISVEGILARKNRAVLIL